MSKTKRLKRKAVQPQVVIEKYESFFVVVKSPNGAILHESEGYVRKADALAHATALAKVFGSKPGFTVVDEQKHKWVLQKNGKLMNTTRFLRKKLLPPLKAVLLQIDKKKGAKFIRSMRMSENVKKMSPAKKRKA